MTSSIQNGTSHEDRPLTREDIEKLLREVSSSDALDLSGRNLRNIDLSHINLEGVNLSYAHLSEANLSETNLTGANLTGAFLNDADLSNANLGGATLDGAVMPGTNLSGAIFIGGYPKGNPIGQDLREYNLSRALFIRVDLSGAYLNSCSFEGASLYKTDLGGSHINSTSFQDARFFEVDLSGAYLNSCSFEGASLYKTDLGGSHINSTSFQDARFFNSTLPDAKLSLVNLRRAVLIASDLSTTQLVDTNLTETTFIELGSEAIRIRIVEKPLTAQNLAMIISALTELTTKFWLIAKGRFADLIEYTQTHNGRFAEEAQTVITSISYNSPFNMDWKVDLSAPGVAEALVTTIDGITQRQERLEKAKLENQAKAQEIKEAEQKAEQENQAALLEQEKQRLELEQRRLEVLEKQLEVQKKGIEYALEIASKVIDTLHPGADPATRAMEIQALLPNLVQLQNGKGLEKE